jgi:excisionase family DNA binding protein
MPWLTTEEAAEILDYNVEYIRRLIRSGRLEAKKHGHIWLVDPESVENLRRTLIRQIQEGYSKYDPRRGT